MVTFAASTWLWTSPFQKDSLHLLEKVKHMGFDAVEIPVEYPELIDVSGTKKVLDDLDLDVVVCGAFGPSRDLTNEDSKIHETCFQYIRECFDICNAWGAGFLVGPMYAAVGKARMLSPEDRKKEWELAVKNLGKVCEMAGAEGLSIAIEPLNRFETDLVNTAEDVMRLVKDINHPSAKVILDSFHMTIEERNLKTAFETVGEKLIHVQVSENYRGTPGTGLTPWNELKAGIDSIGYEGVVSIESFTPELKELAGAVCFWKPMAESQDAFATNGLAFLKDLFAK
ncbi:MAG: sugar phosphate isomerase/epimerase family protein [Bacteroidia bacterium]|nr:sugar phosphate isomerase/epimerase family protein [Bacteroidia bacterium]